MDLNSALDILVKDLREAREIIDDLRNIKGVPLLQVELAKAKCRNAEEIITLLKKMNLGELSPAGEQQTARPVASEPQPAAVFVTEAPEVKKPEPEAVPDPPAVLLEIPEPPAETPPEYNPPQKKQSKASKTILADKFTEPESRINEKIKGTRTDDDISSKLKQTPINNLADAIGINDKFFFIREIFSGDSGAYHDAINRLNGISSLSEADSIIAPYKKEDTDQSAVTMLLDLVKRKTGING